MLLPNLECAIGAYRQLLNGFRRIGGEVCGQYLFERRGGLRRLKNLRAPFRQYGGNLIVILFGNEFVGARLDFAQNGFDASLDPVLRPHMKFAETQRFFLGKGASKGRERQARGKKTQRSSLAVLKKLTSADRVGTAILL